MGPSALFMMGGTFLTGIPHNKGPEHVVLLRPFGFIKSSRLDSACHEAAGDYFFPLLRSCEMMEFKFSDIPDSRRSASSDCIIPSVVSDTMVETSPMA